MTSNPTTTDIDLTIAEDADAAPDPVRSRHHQSRQAIRERQPQELARPLNKLHVLSVT